MKIITTFFLLIALVVCSVSFLFVNADGKKPEDFRCAFCRDFVRRVLTENESPKTACATGKLPSVPGDVSNACGFLLKQHRLLTELEKIQHEYHHRNIKIDKNDQRFFRSACIHFTSSAVIEDGIDTPLCPRFEDTFEGKKLHADATGLDIRVAAPSTWMSPNLVRITVIDNNLNNTNTTHTQIFLDQFSYNANYKYFTLQKVVHTGLFPVNPGQVSNIVLGDNLVTLPINLPKQHSSPVRGLLLADPCWSSTYMNCPFGQMWSVLPRLTQLLNTLANKKEQDALHFWTVLGDNGYDEPEGTALPELYTNLNAAAAALPSLITFGNHDGWALGGCSAHGFSGPNPKGATTIQYSGQNTLASAADPKNNPFDWTGFNLTDSKTPAAASNFFSTGMIGNMFYIMYSGANTLEETMPHFQEACQFVKQNKPTWTMIMSHWSGENCNCAPGMSTPAVYELLITLDGCKQVANTIKFIQGHSHQNVVVKANTGFTVGGQGMGEAFGYATYGFPFLDTFNDRIRIWNFHIAYANSTGDGNWNALIDCVNQEGGLHFCTHLAELWLDQPVSP